MTPIPVWLDEDEAAALVCEGLPMSVETANALQRGRRKIEQALARRQETTHHEALADGAS